MLRTLVSKIIRRNYITDDIVVIDSILPNKDAIGPRNSDCIEFSQTLPGFRYYTMYPMMPGPKAWFSHGYGMTAEEFAAKLPAYEAKYPAVKGKVRHLSPNHRYRFNLAYTYFLAETYTLLPFLEKHQIPFVFLLNPGGAFGIDNESSDNMLRAILTSKYFRKVIVTQKPFEEYLIRKKLCTSRDVIFDFSGSSQFKPDDVLSKQYYLKEKSTFDICFVAAKYSAKGADKGYDLFIAAAKKLAKQYPDMRFHVVGGFDEHDIDVSDIRDAITFYGFIEPTALPKFYSHMDIYLSPNRPFVLYKGNSDGFPLSAGAMYCGVAGFNTDELHLNTEFKDDEVVIIKPQAKDIIEKVKYFYAHLEKLYKLSHKGQKRAQKLYNIEEHIKNRVLLFKSIKQVDA